MVSAGSFVTMIISLLISLVLPIVVYIIYGVRNKGKGVWLAWGIGAMGFFVLQIIIRVPILSLIQMTPGFADFVADNYVIYCGVLAVTAAGFELVGRLVAAKIMSKSLTYEKGFAAGLGHGGIEAIFLVGMTYINNILYSIMINTGLFDTMIEQTAATGVDTSQLALVKETLINTDSMTFLLGGYERLLTMVLHLALSLIICYFWKQGKVVKGAVICMIVHALVDFATPIISGLSTDYLGNVITQNTAYIIIYSLLTIVAVACVAVIKVIKTKWVQADVLETESTANV